MKTIYQRLQEAKALVDHHESDLYVKDNNETIANIINQYKDDCEQRGIVCLYERIDENWIEFPFCYDPFYIKKTC